MHETQQPEHESESSSSEEEFEAGEQEEHAGDTSYGLTSPKPVEKHVSAQMPFNKWQHHTGAKVNQHEYVKSKSMQVGRLKFATEKGTALGFVDRKASVDSSKAPFSPGIKFRPGPESQSVQSSAPRAQKIGGLKAPIKVKFIEHNAVASKVKLGGSVQ